MPNNDLSIHTVKVDEVSNFGVRGHKYQSFYEDILEFGPPITGRTNNSQNIIEEINMKILPNLAIFSYLDDDQITQEILNICGIKKNLQK